LNLFKLFASVIFDCNVNPPTFD